MPGNIRRRGSHYQASVEVPSVDGSRSRIWRTFSTKQQAELWIADNYVALQTKGYVAPSKRTLGEAFDEFELTSRRSPEARRAGRSYDVRIVRAFGRLPLQQISAPMLERFVAELPHMPRLDGRSGVLMDGSVNHIIRRLTEFYRWAEDRGYIASKPTKSIRRIRRANAREMTILSIDEAKSMLGSIVGSPLEAPVWLALAAGLRRSEALAVRRTDLDLEAGTVTVRAALTRQPGGARLGQPKSSSSRRTVKLSPECTAVLRRVLAEGDARWCAPSEWVCRAPVDGQRWNPGTLSKRFVLFLSRSGRRPMHFHDLRHTHASHLIAAGVHIKVISMRLGHANIGITMDLYGHLIPGVEDEAVRRWDGLFGHGSGPAAA